ncbi:MAG: hypothetical protein Q9191_006685 [Dirinaria sp. TL-2023a]
MSTSTTNSQQTTTNRRPRRPHPRHRQGKQIPNYLEESHDLPPNLTQEEMIVGYPNHLRGKLLLQLSKNWTPTEIAAHCPAPEINKNTVGKRLQAARQQFEPGYKPRTQKKRKTTAQAAEDGQPENSGATSTSLFLPEETSAPNPSSQAPHHDETQLLKFRHQEQELLEDQGGILRHAEAIDPDFTNRNWLPTKLRKENVALDRRVVNQAVVAWEEEKELARGLEREMQEG